MARQKKAQTPNDVMNELDRTKDDYVLIIGGLRFRVLKHSEVWTQIEMEGLEGCAFWILWKEITAVIRVEVV